MCTRGLLGMAAAVAPLRNSGLGLHFHGSSETGMVEAKVAQLSQQQWEGTLQTDPGPWARSVPAASWVFPASRPAWWSGG